MITIACVYWKSRKGPEYIPNGWIDALQRMIDRNVTVPYRFVCLSNTRVPCERIPLENNWDVWWSKVELFRPGLFEGRVFYLDLDTIIVGNIDELLEREEKFIALKPFNPHKGLLRNYFASGLMSWEADGTYDFIYEKFAEDPVEYRRQFRGDQDYMSHIVSREGKSFARWQYLVPGIYSYKRHIHNGAIKTENAKVICFHGNPRPWKVKVYEDIIGK